MTGFDFIAHCRPGMVLKTKDRREVRIGAVDPAAGIISGVVQMVGPCAWTAEGRYAEAPAGAAGPLDLAVPVDSSPDAKAQAVESIAEALNDPATRSLCCD